MRDMIDDVFLNVFIIIITGIILIVPILSIVNYLRKDEYIKQLEQSLQEQIQEKQVYINILERKENAKGFKNIY